MSAAFSQSLDNVLQAVDPRKRPAGRDVFPRPCKDADLRVGPAESVQAWFRRLVDGPLEGDIQACTIEDNLGIVLQFAWDDDRHFRSVCCQALAVIGGTLLDAYVDPAEVQIRYLRLEYDANPLTLGSLFSHPVAHVHAQPSESPRFALEMGDDHLILIDSSISCTAIFCHTAWSRWADSVWRRTATDADSAAYFHAIHSFLLEEGGPGKRARVADMLALCKEWLPRIKRALRDDKAEMPMNLAVDDEHLSLFSYHL